jgi:hypothetical protein
LRISSCAAEGLDALLNLNFRRNCESGNRGDVG